MERIENMIQENFRFVLEDAIFSLADEAYLEGKTKTAIELVEGVLKSNPDSIWAQYRLEFYSSKIKNN